MSRAINKKTAQPHLPRDARLIALLLAANGAEDCEEGVVRMLVEFAHRYTTGILTDSLAYAEHARATSTTSAAQPLVPSLDDIRLAVQARTDGATLPKEFLLQLATSVNSVPLPIVPEVYGVRLPPVEARLTAPNFTLIPRSASTKSNDPSTEAEPAKAGTEEQEEEEEEEEEDEDDDEEMEDVTAGMGGGGTASGSHRNRRSVETKRKADQLDDENYD